MSTTQSTLLKVISFLKVIFSVIFSTPNTLQVDEFSMYMCSPSIFCKVKNIIFSAHTCLVALISTHHYSKLLSTLTQKTITDKFILKTSREVINLTGIGLSSPSFYKVPLLSFISTIISQMPSLVVDVAFFIELFSNSFHGYNKPFLSFIYIVACLSIYYNSIQHIYHDFINCMNTHTHAKNI